MRRILQIVLTATLALATCVGAAFAQSRHALVIGNGAYQSAAPLKTPATDAAIVTETLRAAGYDVTDLRDVRQADVGQVMRDFLDKVAGAGPDGAAFVYYSGYAAQSGGENYLVPVDAVINNDGDVADEAFRLNDLIAELAKTPLAARVVVLDASRDHKFGVASGKPVAKGLAMGDTTPELLLAFAAAPGAIAIDGDGDYSIYTGALVTLMRQPGLTLEQIFKAVRLQINQTTGGAQTPWMAGDLSVDVSLFAATPSAPPVQTTPSGARIPSKEDRVVDKDTMRRLSPAEAYAAAVEEDSLEAYQSFVELYPKDERAPQVWDIIETRREAVLWRRTLAQNTTRAYWNYLKRYPNGAHAAEAQEQLADLSAPVSPPVNYIASPEPLPPDYYDEAVGLEEVVPEGYDAPPTVFDVLAPLFIPRGPRFVDGGRRRFVPDRIPGVRGNPVGSFTKKTGRDGKGTRDGKTTVTGNKKTGVTGGKTPIDKGSNIGGRKVRDGKTTATGGTPTGKKTGVTLPTSKNTSLGTRGPTTTTTTTTTPGTRGPTTGGTPGTGTGTRRTGVGLPPSGTHPTTPGSPPSGGAGHPTTAGPSATHPTTPGPTTVRPATPTGPTTVHPTTPTGPVTNRPGLPPVPGSTTVRPTTPTTSVPTIGQRPGLPPVPTTTTVRPTTPIVPPTGAHPTTPTVTAPHPTTPTVTPPTGRPPTPTPPTAHPTTPTPHPVQPTVTSPRPPQPTAHPTTTPTVRPTAPAAHPTVTPPRPPQPAAHPTPRPPQPTVRTTPPRPSPPVVRPAAPPPRPAAAPSRAPSCSMVNGKKVCR